MTNLLISGDYVPDSTGGIRRAENRQGLLSEILFRLTCRRGSFPCCRIWAAGCTG